MDIAFTSLDSCHTVDMTIDSRIAIYYSMATARLSSDVNAVVILYARELAIQLPRMKNDYSIYHSSAQS